MFITVLNILGCGDNMNWYKIYVDIIGPILCSLIGGLLTVLGVYLTIWYEKKKDKEMTIFNSKPLFYRLDFLQDYDMDLTKNYYLRDYQGDNKKTIIGVFKNTDKSYLVLDYVLINNKKHLPIYGNVINKDEIFNLCIYTHESITINKDIILAVKDIFDNKYEYKIEYSIDVDGNAKIVGFKEINKNKIKVFWLNKLKIKKINY